MKNTTTLFAFLLTATLFSCKKDDSSKVADGQEIGKWNLVSNTCDNGKTVTEAVGETFTINFTVLGKNFDTTIELKEDGSYTSEGSYSQVISTSFLGVEEETEADHENLFGEGTYKLEGDEITFEYGSESITLKVDELTDTKMVLIHEVNKVENAAGTLVTNTGTYYYTLER